MHIVEAMRSTCKQVPLVARYFIGLDLMEAVWHTINEHVV